MFTSPEGQSWPPVFWGASGGSAVHSLNLVINTCATFEIFPSSALGGIKGSEDGRSTVGQTCALGLKLPVIPPADPSCEV